VIIDSLPDLKMRMAHLNPKSLCFVGARNDTAIIVGQNNHRSVIELWFKDSLAGNKKIVPIHQR
jgi:hypothetical protein